MTRDLLEKTALDIALASMEYIGDNSIYDDAAQADDETLINYICDFVYEILG